MIQKSIEAHVADVLGSEWEHCSPEVEMWPAPHVPRPLPVGKQAIFGFLDPEGRVLFIGQAGPKSNARFQSQHYHPSSSPSNLAKALRRHAAALGLGEILPGHEGDWIKLHLSRFNVYLSAECPRDRVRELKHRLILELQPLLQTRTTFPLMREGEIYGPSVVKPNFASTPASPLGERVFSFPLQGRLKEVRVRQVGGLSVVEIQVGLGEEE